MTQQSDSSPLHSLPVALSLARSLAHHQLALAFAYARGVSHQCECPARKTLDSRNSADSSARLQGRGPRPTQQLEAAPALKRHTTRIPELLSLSSVALSSGRERVQLEQFAWLLLLRPERKLTESRSRREPIKHEPETRTRTRRDHQDDLCRGIGSEDCKLKQNLPQENPIAWQHLQSASSNQISNRKHITSLKPPKKLTRTRTRTRTGSELRKKCKRFWASEASLR